MNNYKIVLALGTPNAASAREAADETFASYFNEALYQPDELEVVDVDTGEVNLLDVKHLHSDNKLYGPQVMSNKLRSPFQFIVDQIFEIPDRGTVTVGRITAGTVKVNDNVNLQSGVNKSVHQVKAIEHSRSLTETAYFTEVVGLMFSDLDRRSINPGDVIFAD
jgi:translation elongation factor EF-Tu-like GTPase